MRCYSTAPRAPATSSLTEPLERRVMLTAATLAADLIGVPDDAYEPGHILVKYRDATAVRAVAAGTAVGSRVGHARAWREVALGGRVGVRAALAAYRADPAVEYAEPDWRVRAAATSTDPYFARGGQWGLGGDEASPTSAYGSQAAEAWADGSTGAGTDGRTVYVGVLDEGVDFSHPDLARAAWTNPFDPVDGVDNDGNGYVDDAHGWDFYNNDGSVYDGGGADRHGTHVAGIIAADGANGVGAAGVAWDVKLISAKFLGPKTGSISGAVRALDYFVDLKLRHGLNIVATNNSWGDDQGFSNLLADAIDRAARAGILFVAAAGNGGDDFRGDDNDATPDYPSGYETVPAAGYDAVVSVAAIDAYGAIGPFSNYGAQTVDLGAPGVSVLSTVPDNGYASLSGTSMAAPHVTGAIALFAAAHPEASAAQVRAAILDAARATPTASLAGRTSTGGRLNVSLALRVADKPADPTDLQATPATDTSVNLTWVDRSGNEQGFRVERQAADGAWAQAGTVGPDVTAWADSGLSPETAYSYRVLAYRNASVSDYSNVATATTPATPVPPPSAPYDLRAPAVSTGTVTLGWAAGSTDEDGVEVERSNDGGATWLPVAAAGADATAYVVGGLSAATGYAFRVRAFRDDVAGRVFSDYSPALAATTAAAAGGGTGLRGDYYDNLLVESTTNPSAYTLSGWKFARTDATINANWGTAAPAQGALRLAPDSWTVKWAGLIQPRYTDAYTFRFERNDGVGMWVTVDGVRRPLWTPTWDRLDGKAGDRTATEYSSTAAVESAPLALRAGVKYPVEIVYYDYTGAASAKLLWRSAAYQPQEVVPQSQLYQGPSFARAVAVSKTQVTLNWVDNATGETGFKIERSVNGGAWAQIAVVGANATSYADTGLTAGKTYAYRVRAYNSSPAFHSAYSAVATAKTPV